MSIEIQCDGCGIRLRAPQTAAGKTKKCPKCGGTIQVPSPQATDTDAAAEPQVNWYDLAIEPEPAATAYRPAPDAAEAAEASPSASDQTPTGPGMSSYMAAYTANLKQRDDYAAGPKPLFNVMGKEVTWRTLAGLGAALLLVLAFVGWWTRLGPGRMTRVVTAKPVYAVTALDGVTRVDAYSLGRGTGSMAVGVKGVGGSPSAMHTIGGSDQVIITRDDAQGDHLFINLDISRSFMNRNKMTSQYDLVFSAGDFELAPADGSSPPAKAVLLYESYESQTTVDLASSKSTDHRGLFPPGITPTAEVLGPKPTKPLEGKRHYNGSAGARGDVEFTIFRDTTGFGPSGGFFADGMLKVTDPGGSIVDYQYNGGEVLLSWNAGSQGNWVTDRYTKLEGDSPFTKYRVGLLFERPVTDARLKLLCKGKPIATLPKSLSGDAPSQGGLAGKVNDPLTSYFSLLAEARNKARSTVSDSNMLQIGLGIQMYVDQNHGQFPDRIEDLRTVVPGIDAVMLNKRTGENPGYIYIKPEPDALKRPNQAAILYESRDGRIDPDGSVLYADGHIETRN